MRGDEAQSITKLDEPIRHALRVLGAVDHQHRMIEIGLVGCIQRRVSVEYLHAAHGKDDQRQRNDPMCQPNDDGVAVDSFHK